MPSAVAVTQPLVQPGGSTVTPGVSRPAVPAYTDPLISRSPGWKAPPSEPRGAALALVAASTGATAVTASASSAGARQRRLAPGQPRGNAKDVGS